MSKTVAIANVTRTMEPTMEDMVEDMVEDTVEDTNPIYLDKGFLQDFLLETHRTVLVHSVIRTMQEGRREKHLKKDLLSGKHTKLLSWLTLLLLQDLLPSLVGTLPRSNSILLLLSPDPLPILLGTLHYCNSFGRESSRLPSTLWLVLLAPQK